MTTRLDFGVGLVIAQALAIRDQVPHQLPWGAGQQAGGVVLVGQ